MSAHIRNASALATTPARRDALAIAEAGLTAIDTARVIEEQVRLAGDTLTIAGHTWDLTRYTSVSVIGFGKVSCAAAQALEHVLGDRIAHGIALTNTPGTCATIELCEATHPLPSEQNVRLSERLVAQCAHLTEHDLVIVIVSGGGSAMLCWPASECDQGTRLYHAANRSGMTIRELNTVRKHLSTLKGGGLAKLLHPATVIGLIFSDVPSDIPDIVASGPTYLDATTAADAQAIIDQYQLGTFILNETPKDGSLFTVVTNIVLATNDTALHAMAHQASALGYTTTILDATYAPASELVAALQAHAAPGTVVLAGGEVALLIPSNHGSGGRNQQCALTATSLLQHNQVFTAIASDGIDNGPWGGALVDTSTAERARDTGYDVAAAGTRCDATPLLTATGDLLDIGPTGANVADLYLLLTPKENDPGA